MTVEVIPQETDEVDELLSEQLKRWSDNPFDASSAVYVFERTVIPYKEVEELFRSFERKGYSSAVIKEMKHHFASFWSREINVEELFTRVNPLVDEMGRRHKTNVTIPTEFEVKYCFARDLVNTMNGGEVILGLFHDINEALAFINSTKPDL